MKRISKLEPNEDGFPKPSLQYVHEILLNAIERNSTIIRFKYGHTKFSILELVPQENNKGYEWKCTGELSIRLFHPVMNRFKIMAGLGYEDKRSSCILTGKIKFRVIPWSLIERRGDGRILEVPLIAIPNKKYGDDIFIDLVPQ